MIQSSNDSMDSLCGPCMISFYITAKPVFQWLQRKPLKGCLDALQHENEDLGSFTKCTPQQTVNYDWFMGKVLSFVSPCNSSYSFSLYFIEGFYIIAFLARCENLNCILKLFHTSVNQSEAELLCPLLDFNRSKVHIQ